MFPIVDGTDSVSRSAGYKALVGYIRKWVVNLPDGYGSYLKEMYFSGLLPEVHEEGLGRQEPFLICLASPEIDRDFVIDTFNCYKYPSIPAGIVKDYRMFFDGQDREVEPSILDRYRFIVESLSDDRAAWLQGGGFDYRPLYFVFYTSVFSALSLGKSSEGYIGCRFIEYVESILEEISDLYDGKRELEFLRDCIEVIFKGEAECQRDVDRDPVLIGYIDRFFGEALPPTLQSMTSEIYEGIPSDSRLSLVDGKIVR